MIAEITDCTNVWLDKNRSHYSRERDCQNTMPQEIKCVIGLLCIWLVHTKQPGSTWKIFGEVMEKASSFLDLQRP